MEISILGFKVRLEVLIACVVLYFVIWGHVLCSCTNKDAVKTSVKEGLQTISKIANKDITIDLASADATPPSTKSWFNPDLTYVKGQKPDAAVQDILNRPKQPVPLPKGESLMFAKTQFKPECCPNSYSTGSGCACMTVDQYNYLIDRGGNNVPYSEY